MQTGSSRVADLLFQGGKDKGSKDKGVTDKGAFTETKKRHDCRPLKSLFLGGNHVEVRKSWSIS